MAQSVKGNLVVNMDETGWQKENGRAWLWTAVTDRLSLFHIDAQRSGDVSGSCSLPVIATASHGATSLLVVQTTRTI